MACKGLSVRVRLAPPIIPNVVAAVAQLVRALVCGTRGRGFKFRRSPHFLIENPGLRIEKNNLIFADTDIDADTTVLWG